MSIRITAHFDSHVDPSIVNINVTATGHVLLSRLWFSSRMGPIPGYPARVPSANKVHTRRSVTSQANRLRAVSNPTLRYISAVGLVGRTDGEWTRIHALSAKPDCQLFTRGRSIGIAAEDAHCLNNVRGDLKDAILADVFVRSYLETALWSSTMMPEDSETSDLSYERANFDPSDCSLETVIGALRDCREFQKDKGDVLARSDYPIDRDAHDFWLSRNGHGAGFFDRGTDDGDTLQDAARAYGEVNLYHVGDNDSMVIYSDADVDILNGCTSDLSAVWS